MNEPPADPMKTHNARTDTVADAAPGVGAANALFEIIQPLQERAMFRHRASEAGRTMETALAHSALRCRERRL